MWLWPLNMPTQSFLIWSVLLMLMLWNVMMTVWSIFWSWGLEEILKLEFGEEFWSWILVKSNWSWVTTLGLTFDWALRHMFGQEFGAKFWSTCDLTEKSFWSEHWTFAKPKPKFGFVVPLAMFDHFIVFFCFITFVFVLAIGVEFCEPISWQFQIAPIRLIDSEALATGQENCSLRPL